MFPQKEPVYTYEHTLRSRYGETDKMGYVYYGRYLEYFEEARTEMIRSLGFPYSKLEEEGFMLPVISAHADYKAPIFYDELMQIRVLIFDIPSVKLETYYEVYTNRRNTPHVLGEVILCFMQEKNRKPCRAPRNFLECMQKAVDESNGMKE